MTRTKYGAKRTQVDGIWFDSKAEAARYQELKLMLRAGAIRTLEIHLRYPLIVKGAKVADYEADFDYWEQSKEDGSWFPVTEDVKGYRTPVYLLKRKLFAAIYGRDIRES